MLIATLFAGALEKVRVVPDTVKAVVFTPSKDACICDASS